LRLEEWLLFLTLLTFPFDLLFVTILGTGTALAEGFTPNKLLALLFVSVTIWKLICSRDVRAFRVVFGHSVSILGICYIAVAIVGVLPSPTPEHAIPVVVNRVSMFFFYLAIVWVIRDRRLLRLSIACFVGSSVFTGIAGSYEVVTGKPVINEIRYTDSMGKIGADIQAGKNRIRGLHANSDNHGVSLIMQLGGLLYLLITTTTAKGRIALSALLTIIVLNIVATGSRGCWLGMVLVVGGVFLLAPFRRKRRVFLGACAAILTAIPLIGAICPDLAVFDKLTDSAATATLATKFRGGQARVSLAMVRRHPWLGIGTGNWPYQSTRYASSVPWALKTKWLLPHNGFLGNAAENGIIGLTVFCAFLFSAVSTAFWSVRFAPDRDGKLMAIGLLGSVLAYVFCLNLFVVCDTKYAWTSIAFAVALARIFRKARQWDSAENADPDAGSADRSRSQRLALTR